MKSILILLAVALVGCSSDDAPKADDGTGTGVQLVTLKDGTRCAVAYGGSYARPSGVDCDWQPKRVER